MQEEELDKLGFHDKAMERKPRVDPHGGRKEGRLGWACGGCFTVEVAELCDLLQARASSPASASRSRVMSSVEQAENQNTSHRAIRSQ